jgi:hypothetical protein
MQQEGGKEAKNNSKSKSKGKGKGKGKGKAKAGNDVGDGPPVRELSSSRHPTDPWDDLRNAWAMEISQSKEGGPSHGTHPNQNQNQNQNHSKQQKQPPKQQKKNNNNNNNHHPNGQQPGSASSAQNRRGRGGGGGGGGGGGDGAHVHAGQKRKATESVTNGITGTDDGGDRGQAPKRQKSEKRPPQDPPGAAARSHPDFWHPDGSVIIQVEKTKFRLHQSTLQKFSAYFAAMFRGKGSHRRGGRAYLEVEIDERSPNGHHLPVYRVAETTADDFAALLTVIEESMCVTVLSILPAPRP